MKISSLFTATVSLIMLVSCSTKDEQFCRCLELGNELNEASSKALNGVLSADQVMKIKDLKTRQKKECSSYHQLDGVKLKELQQVCSDR